MQWLLGSKKKLIERVVNSINEQLRIILKMKLEHLGYLTSQFQYLSEAKVATTLTWRLESWWRMGSSLISSVSNHLYGFDYLFILIRFLTSERNGSKLRI